MKSTAKAENAANPKLWALPEHPGAGDKPRKPSHKTTPKKQKTSHKNASASGPSGSENSHPVEPQMNAERVHDPTAGNVPHRTQPAKHARSSRRRRRAHDPRVIYSSRNPAPASDVPPTSSYLPGRTYGVMTVTGQGWYLHPSHDALSLRMNSLYPGYKCLINDTEAEQKGDRAHVSHIKEVWRIVTTVDAELTAKISASPQVNIELNQHTSFGVQVNYLIKMHGTTQQPLRPGQTGKEGNTQNQSLPSHEEMMAYKILNKPFAFPNWIADILRGTANEYLLYPLPPGGPVVKAVPQGPSSSSMERIAHLEARLNIAKKELTKYKAQTEAGKQQAESEAKQRRAEILDGAKRQVKENEARSKDIKKMIAFMEQSANEAEELHNQRIASSQKLLDQVGRWRKEGKLDDKDSSSDDQEGGEGDDETESEDGEKSEQSCSEEDSEESQRPAKIRRTG